jgi:hypothetical protein
MNLMRIVPAMKKTAVFLGFLLAAAVPAAAQTNELGILVGGSKTMKSGAGTGPYEHGLSEIYYGVQLEPGTFLRIKVGKFDAQTAFDTGTVDAKGKKIFDVDKKGSIDHADAIVDYRFSEAWGSSGLFAGAGMYRQHGVGREETNIGLQIGVNGIFPLSRRYGIVAEGAYHWIAFYRPRPRYVTGGVGLRMTF